MRLQFDVERIDPYGRTLAYVWLGDELFNETLVREGYAFVTTYPPNVRYVDRFRAAQREARSAGRGVWGRCVHEGACDPAYPDGASRHHRPTSTARTSTSAGSRCCRPISTTSTGTTTAWAAATE